MSREGQSLTFKYDYNGMRTQKVLEHSWYPETTNYYLHGQLLTHMTVDYRDTSEASHQDVMHFFYDAQSRPAKVSLNGVMYTYIHNLQGDIVELLDNSGALVVEYKYDAWGKLIATTGSMAATLGKRNPFRYRGYVYDEETGLYYLRSRYYNPLVGRFVNADSTIPRALLKDNTFAYCVNSPIAKCDESGRISQSALLGVAAAAIAGAIYGATSVARRRKITSEDAKKHLDSLMGDGYSNRIYGRFWGTSGKAKITTAEMKVRNGALTFIDATVSFWITKNICDPIETLSKLSPWLGIVASGFAANLDTPLNMMFGVRDGYYTYYSYTWYRTFSIFGIGIDIGDVTYEIKDYGGGYTEVWLATNDYIFPEESTLPVKIKSGEYE